jgi:hypothetical protein
MKNMWEKIEEINAELKEYILCIPPYRDCYNEKFIGDLYKKMKKKKPIAKDVARFINSPESRAFQMEFRYKKAKIFEPYMPVLEYGIFSSMVTDWVCSYLTLLPVVEASVRKWMEFEPSLSLQSLHKFYYTFGKYFRNNIGRFDDCRENVITSEYVKYLRYSFKMLYMGFEEYNRKQYKDIFNRNMALHRLEGAVTLSESWSNVTRITLLLDVIAELYLMQEDPENWHNCIRSDSEYEQNIDYQLRKLLYEKKAMQNLGHEDMLIVQNVLVGKASDRRKKALIEQQKRMINLLAPR